MLYKDAISACLLDCGYLTTTERYLLEKLRIDLNISEKKAYSLEKDSDGKSVELHNLANTRIDKKTGKPTSLRFASLFYGDRC